MTLGGDLSDWQSQAIGIQDTTLASLTLNPGGHTAVMNVSQYDSIELSSGVATTTTGQVVTVKWFDVIGARTFTDILTIYADAGGVTQPRLILPVRGVSVQIENTFGPALTLALIGSPRDLPGLLGNGYADILTGQLNPGTFVALVPQDLIVGPPLSQGLHQLDMAVSGTTNSGSLIALVETPFGGPLQITLAHTGEAVATGGNLRVIKQVILPASTYKLQWFPNASATYTVVATFIALGH